MSTYENAVVENTAIKYYLEMTVDFQRTTQDGYIQSTSARFFILTTTSDVENFHINNVLLQLLEKVDAFSGQNSGWTVSQVKYLRLCWGSYRLLEVGTFIPTRKHRSKESRYEHSQLRRLLFSVFRTSQYEFHLSQFTSISS